MKYGMGVIRNFGNLNENNLSKIEKQLKMRGFTRSDRVTFRTEGNYAIEHQESKRPSSGSASTYTILWLEK